jgi:membrane dipeptidase
MTNNPLIIDGHNDTLLNLYKQERGGGRSFFIQDERGHIDLPRALSGGLGGGFFAMFVPPPMPENFSEKKKSGPPSKADIEAFTRPIDVQYAQEVTNDLIQLLFEIETDSDGKVQVVRNADEIAKCLEDDVLAAILHFEGAEAIDPDVSNLEDYYAQGLRSVGLTWSRSNVFAHGVPFGFNESPDTGPGLTDAGKNLVSQCNKLGIVIDLSHLNEKGFWDVADITDAPLVATHSAAHQICPSTRNLTDKQIDAVGESDGIIGINFHVGFIRPDGKRDSNTPLSDLVDHVVYVADRIGVDYVALGSDFDGATMPDELGDVSGLPKLVSALRSSGFNEEELKKIAHENWLRVLSKTWSG